MGIGRSLVDDLVDQSQSIGHGSSVLASEGSFAQAFHGPTMEDLSWRLLHGYTRGILRHSRLLLHGDGDLGCLPVSACLLARKIDIPNSCGENKALRLLGVKTRLRRVMAHGCVDRQSSAGAIPVWIPTSRPSRAAGYASMEGGRVDGGEVSRGESHRLATWVRHAIWLVGEICVFLGSSGLGGSGHWTWMRDVEHQRMAGSPMETC